MIPANPSITINDLIPGVKAALQNRADVNELDANPAMRPSRWIKRSLQEITDSYPFEELRRTGPNVVLTVNRYNYPIASFLNSGDDYTTIYGLSIYIDFPANTIAFPMDYMTPKAIEPLLHIPGGFPFKYTRYGDQVFVGTSPGQGYTTFMRYQVRHPFDESDLPSTPALIDPSWQDIVEYAAAQRGAVALRWPDQATYLHQMLYGDPEYQVSGGKRGRPGLIAARIFQQERDENMNTRQLSPQMAHYNPR